MIEHRRLIRHLTRACDIASFMLAGAVLLAMYLAYADPSFDRPLMLLRASLSLALGIFGVLGTWLRPAARGRMTDRAKTGWSGIVFIVVTGLAAFAFFAWAASAVGGYIISATILIATFAMAVVLWPISAGDADEIG
jgi:cytochrome bd-type quinol oxidase subunit 2